MKGTLIKSGNNYYLEQIPSKGITGSILEGMIGSTDGEGYYKLSKQNCDEIFGVVDVEKLAEEEFPYDFDSPLFETLGVTEKSHKSILIGMLQGTLIKGFNKAIELNKDKQFTLEDVRKAIAYGENFRDMDEGKVPYQTFVEFIQSLQRPTEIEVEIEMIQGMKVNGIQNPFPVKNSNGCLILKKL
jgi:hypothetical protein